MTNQHCSLFFFFFFFVSRFLPTAKLAANVQLKELSQLYDNAFREIRKLMESDSFVRFQLSSKFARFNEQNSET
jgi:hypothetical protein